MVHILGLGRSVVPIVSIAQLLEVFVESLGQLLWVGLGRLYSFHQGKQQTKVIYWIVGFMALLHEEQDELLNQGLHDGLFALYWLCPWK